MKNRIFSDLASWPGVCTTGKRQSPVDIGLTQVTKKIYDMETIVNKLCLPFPRVNVVKN